jgi:hypothetical protein
VLIVAGVGVVLAGFGVAFGLSHHGRTDQQLIVDAIGVLSLALFAGIGIAALGRALWMR